MATKDTRKSEESVNLEETIKVSERKIVSQEKEVGEPPAQPRGPIGLDIGTSHIVMAQSEGKKILTTKQLNAFFTIPFSKFTKSILQKNDISFFQKDNLFYILGYSADNFANMFNTQTRRTMKDGVVCATEQEGATVLKSIIDTLIGPAHKKGETICFSIPGEPYRGVNSTIYHDSIIKMFLSDLDYKPMSINEGMAVVMSELVLDNFTGLGISIGGGMCNVCLAFLSVPVITYSLQKAGDYVDTMVGLSIGESATKVKVFKEEELDLLKPPKGRMETSLHIYYDDLVQNLVHSLEEVLHASDKIPQAAQAVPIVLSGGTVMPNGFLELFTRKLEEVSLPIEISEVRMAKNPLNTTAKGAMLMAMSEVI